MNKKIKPLTKKYRFRRWFKSLLGIKSPSEEWVRLDMNIDEMHEAKIGELPPALRRTTVILRYSKEEAAMLFDLLNSEMEGMMSLNTKDRLSKEPIFDLEQREYLHKVMDFCAEQMKVLSKYVDL